MDDDVMNALKEFPDMKGAFLWDNPFMVKRGTLDRHQLQPANMVKAVTWMQGLPRDTSALSFKDLVCRPLKVLELWKTLLLKRFDLVASNSVALERLVSSLSSFSGLQSVLVCCHRTRQPRHSCVFVLAWSENSGDVSPKACLHQAPSPPKQRAR
jgi:hypothetical protein